MARKSRESQQASVGRRASFEGFSSSAANATRVVDGREASEGFFSPSLLPPTVSPLIAAFSPSLSIFLLTSNGGRLNRDGGRDGHGGGRGGGGDGLKSKD